MMKAPILFTIIASTLMLACEPDWVLYPSYKNTCYVKNDSSKELVLKNNIYVKQVIDTKQVVTIGIGKTVTIIYEGLVGLEKNCAPHIILPSVADMWNETFVLLLDGEIVREWSKFDIGKGIQHHFYDDASWSLNKYQKEGDTYYTYYDWTYTITDEDLTIEQSEQIMQP